MSENNLKNICKQTAMPVCLQQAPIVEKKSDMSKEYYFNMPHLQTAKHRFRTYPKPISKIVSL